MSEPAWQKRKGSGNPLNPADRMQSSESGEDPSRSHQVSSLGRHLPPRPQKSGISRTESSASGSAFSSPHAPQAGGGSQTSLKDYVAVEVRGRLRKGQTHDSIASASARKGATTPQELLRSAVQQTSDAQRASSHRFNHSSPHHRPDEKSSKSKTSSGFFGKLGTKLGFGSSSRREVAEHTSSNTQDTGAAGAGLSALSHQTGGVGAVGPHTPAPRELKSLASKVPSTSPDAKKNLGAAFPHVSPRGHAETPQGKRAQGSSSSDVEDPILFPAPPTTNNDLLTQRKKGVSSSRGSSVAPRIGLKTTVRNSAASFGLADDNKKAERGIEFQGSFFEVQGAHAPMGHSLAMRASHRLSVHGHALAQHALAKNSHKLQPHGLASGMHLAAGFTSAQSRVSVNAAGVSDGAARPSVRSLHSPGMRLTAADDGVAMDVVFLININPSMKSELDGVKSLLFRHVDAFSQRGQSYNAMATPRKVLPFVGTTPQASKDSPKLIAGSRTSMQTLRHGSSTARNINALGTPNTSRNVHAVSTGTPSASGAGPRDTMASICSALSDKHQMDSGCLRLHVVTFVAGANDMHDEDSVVTNHISVSLPQRDVRSQKKINKLKQVIADLKVVEAVDSEAGSHVHRQNVLMALASIYKGEYHHSSVSTTDLDTADKDVRVDIEQRKVLCFLITDSAPIRNVDDTLAARSEREWLVSGGYAQNQNDCDIYAVLDRILDQRNGQMIICPILSNAESNLHFYAQCAFLTGGLVLVRKESVASEPSSRESAPRLSVSAPGSEGPSREHIVMTPSRLSANFAVPEEEVFSPRDIDPNSTEALLTVCLTQIIDGIATTALSGDIADNSEVVGYSALNLGLLETVDQELPLSMLQDEEEGYEIRYQAGNTAIALASLRETVREIEDRKWTRRAKNLQLDLVEMSVRIVIAFCRRVLKLPDKDGFIWKQERQKLATFLQNEGDIKIVQMACDDVENMSVDLPKTQPSDDCLACVLMDDVLEIAENGPGSDSMAGWLRAAMKFVVCRFVDMRYPVTKDNQPDFSNCWASEISTVGSTWVKEEEIIDAWREKRSKKFVAPSGWEDSMTAKHCHLEQVGAYEDPKSKNEFSGVLALAHPNDSFAVACFKLMSATPLLDLMTTYFYSGQPILWRNLWGGTCSSTLKCVMRNVRSGFDDDKWDMLRCCVTSLRCHSRPVGGNVARAIARSGVFNPTDSVARFMICLICQGRSAKEIGPLTLRRLAAEHCTYLLMVFNHHHSKAPLSEKGLQDIAHWMHPEDMVVVPEGDIDPLTEQHPCELDPLPLSKGWMDRCSKTLRTHPVYKIAWQDFKTFMLLLDADLHGPPPDLLLDNNDMLNEKQFTAIFAESLLFGKRTCRYKVMEAGPAKGTHVYLGSNIPSLPALARKYLRDHYHHDLRHMRNIRYVAIRAQLIQEAAQIDPDARDSDTQLACLRYSLFDTEYKLSRRDVVDVLPLLVERFGNDRVVNSVLAHNLVLGAWSPDPPAYLRKLHEKLQPFFQGDHLEEVVDTVCSTATCQRIKPNRLGHSVQNPYPGAAGFDENYASMRLEAIQSIKRDKTRSKKRDYLQMMHAYTVFAEGILVALESDEDEGSMGEFGGGVNFSLAKALHRVLSFYMDANRLSDVREAINCLSVTDPMTVEAFLQTPFRMQKVRRGWRQSQIGHTTIAWTLHRPLSPMDSRPTTNSAWLRSPHTTKGKKLNRFGQSSDTLGTPTPANLPFAQEKRSSPESGGAPKGRATPRFEIGSSKSAMDSKGSKETNDSQRRSPE